MTIQELYDEGKEFPSLILLIEYLVYERKVLKMTDDQEKITYYFQDRFHQKMNDYLREYEVKRNGKRIE